MLAYEKPTRQDVFAGTVPIGGRESDQCGEFSLLLRVQQSVLSSNIVVHP